MIQKCYQQRRNSLFRVRDSELTCLKFVIVTMTIMSGALILNNNKLQYRAMAILYLKS